MSYEKLAKQPIDTQMRAAHGILKTIERHLKIEENEQFLMERSAAVKKVNVSSVEKSPTVELFDAEKTLLITENGKVDTRRKCLVSLLDKGSKTPLAVISKGLMNRLTRLGETFPNFEEVVRYYKELLVLESLSSPAVIKLPPVLLIGKPGLGKTRFLSELAGVMKTGFYSTDMSTVSAGFVLAGSSSTWSEGKPGFVSQSLTDSEVANPIVLIDEIDKASGDARYDPLGAFYSLLERHSARRFVDEFLDIELDCSHINWVASANYIEQIPEPIRTRMEMFVIQPPSDEQTGVISQNIYQEMLKENTWGRYFSHKLSQHVLDEIKGCSSPREVRKTLEKACAKVVLRSGRKAKPFSISTSDIDFTKPVVKKRIGF